jgi:hypothetical protein
VVNGVQNTYTYNGSEYRRRSENEARAGLIIASVASGVIMSVLPSFSNPFLKQMNKEHKNNNLYKDAFFKSVKMSGLEEKGLTIVNTCFNNSVEEQLYNSGKKIADGDIKAGLNACYIPDYKAIKLNTEKATISGFHELGHAMNNLKSKFGRILQKSRIPGYTIAGLMGTAALFSRPKPREAKRNLEDVLLDNCGLIAFAGMLPTVAEEALASRNGIKLAKQAGLAEPLVKNLKKFYGKALLSYVGYAVLTGLSVFATSEIMQIFTRPEKISNKNSFYS